MLKIAENSNSIFNLAVYVTKTQGMSDLIADAQRSAQRYEETIKKCTMVPFFGAKSS